MARYFKLLAFALGLLTMGGLTSCQEGGDAGDLFGQWRMDGSDSQYISFAGSVVWLKDMTKEKVFGNFQHVGDSLLIQCYSVEGQPIDTVVVEQSFGFKPFNNIRLKITTLDSDNLVLSKDNFIWKFYKY